MNNTQALKIVSQLQETIKRLNQLIEIFEKHQHDQYGRVLILYLEGTPQSVQTIPEWNIQELKEQLNKTKKGK